MRRARFAFALACMLAACGSGGKAAVGTLPPPKAEASPAGLRTPFAPAPPTAAPFGPPIVPPTPEVWASPGSYGSPPPTTTPIPSAVQPLLLPAGTQNILLLGSDRRSGTGFRTDTIILASLQPQRHTVTLLSIPRDLYVYLPGYSMQRINAAWTYGQLIGYPGGGPQLLFDTIRYNLGLHVDHYALVEMSGFEQAVDTLGGLDVRVACSYTDWKLKARDLEPSVRANWALYTVPSGIVHMDGYDALWYARSRQRSSDYDRARRQQEILRAAFRRGLSLDAFANLPAFYADLRDLVVTDIGLADAGSLALAGLHIDLAHIHSRFIGRPQITGWTIPGSGAQVLLPKPEAIRALLEEAFLFPEEDPAAPIVSVEVVDAAGRPDWAELAMDRLAYAGLEAEPGPATSQREPVSLLLDYGQATDEQRQVALNALGLSPASVVEMDDPSAATPFRLLVGENYNPCFDPAKLN
ncbi:MAG TPA: LCP family protein [Anaerolineales bacterium]|nr:LCP family protein [Anaerolineales bacterium]